MRVLRGPGLRCGNVETFLGFVLCEYYDCSLATVYAKLLALQETSQLHLHPLIIGYVTEVENRSIGYYEVPSGLVGI